METYCLHCNKPTKYKPPAYTGKFCSNRCQQDWHYYNVNLPAMKAAGRNAKIHRAGTIARYLTEKDGRRCSICKNDTWCGKPIPLDIDHIDSDPTNNSIENLRYLCPNCHRQTPTWGMKKHRRDLRTMGRLGRHCSNTAKIDGSIPSSSTT